MRITMPMGNTPKVDIGQVCELCRESAGWKGEPEHLRQARSRGSGSPVSLRPTFPAECAARRPGGRWWG